MEQLLAHNSELSERNHFLPFFRAHPHLSLFLGAYNSNIVTADRLAYELSLFGQFTAGIVVGDWTRKRYCFVELEDGQANSIFAHRGRQTSEWATRFNIGYNQTVDWLWLLETTKNMEPFERQFGKRTIDATMLLVVGRDSGVSPADRFRFEWRRDHIIVNSKRVYYCTFDELLRDLRERIANYSDTP